MAVVAYLSNRLKAFILVIIGAVRRALCCFRRRRRESGDSTPLTGVGIGESSSLEIGDQEWKSWDAPTSVVSERNTMSLIQQQIEQYRQQSTATQEVEPEPDLFQDMTPRITAQPRILLKPAQSDSYAASSRLGLAFDPSLAATSELESWEDNPTSWEAQDSEDVDPDAMLRDKRRTERERRRVEQQSRRHDKFARPQPLGARLS